jgi:NAD-dependent dihydropyrimidine dehydrogenase PreA subunit
MCNYCLKHGPAGKWYLNSRNYSKELAEDLDLKEFLLEQYQNFEQMQVRKHYGFNSVGLGYKLQIPIIGRIIKYFADKMIQSTKTPTNPFDPSGHFGQVVPLDDAIAILDNCACEPIIQKYCMCRYMHRGEKEACCINFGIMSEIIGKLPRFIPDDSKFYLTREEAIKRFTEHNKKGYIGTIWYGPYPYINNLCSCETPVCAGIRQRTQFGIETIFKAEYVASIDQDLCQGCKLCMEKCQFNALEYNSSTQRMEVNQKKCFGCGVCLHECPNNALHLKARNEIPSLKGKY